MDNKGDPKSIIYELLQGLELARQLQVYLHMPSSSQETRELLIQKIISTFEKALEMVNWKGPVGESSQQPSGVAIRMSDSPLSGSPRSEDSDKDLKDQDHNISKKRNTLPRWTKQIRVKPGVGVEGPLDDGYSWRKYGQKDILGAMYPRGYYRCTHRNVQGCLATKQVQRSDEDPTVFEITYRGKHTCTVASNVGSSSSPLENQEPSLNTNPQEQQQQNVLQRLEQQPNEVLLSLRAGLRVQTENLDSPGQSFAPFHFPSTSNIKIENQVFPSPIIENNYAENFTSPSYMSPNTSGISHFSVSPSGVHTFEGHPNLATSASQINDMIPAATSAANSPTVFPFDHFEFDGHNFTFDNPRFFS
ncbi:probable WRKY transcription factor 53 [Abrus precatorius]|uniref:Probable WRKY transcription factor 53 n=1 Tax=Abrus precatorius TaxID=3816 RepID=A0A8B8K5I1_ABRPR|nr:probable WRKY transcription factor 53 [Abrus precatorius]